MTSLQTIYLDFETYYDKDFTLRTTTICAYVNDPRYQTIGCGIAYDDGSPQWFTGKALDLELAKIDWKHTRAVAHNGLFDFAILAFRYNIHPKRMYCTMQGARPWLVPYCGRMSLDKLSRYLIEQGAELPNKGTEVIRAVGKRLEDFTEQELYKYGEYCKVDVELCRTLYKEEMKQLCDSVEPEMIHQTMRKSTKPVLQLDVGRLEEELTVIRWTKESLVRNCGLDDRKKLMSNTKFAELLSQFGVTPPMKESPTTGKATFAFAKTDQGMKDLLGHTDPNVAGLVAARLGVKSTIEESRIQRLLTVAKANVGLPFPMLYWGAHTGRMSGYDKINLQNLPHNSVIREAIKAPDGYQLVVGDLSQIEARLLAYMADDKPLVESFRQGKDVYKEFAAAIYGKSEAGINEEERFVGKTAILGLGYGCGHKRFRDMLRQGVPADRVPDEKVCYEIVQRYRKTYRKIQLFWYWVEEVMLEKMAMSEWDVSGVFTTHKGMVVIPGGRTLHYPQLQKDMEGRFQYKNNLGKWSDIYGGKFVENLIQAMAQVVIRDIELKMAEKLEKYDIAAVGQVHDELIYCVPDEAAPVIKNALEIVMRTPPTWAKDLPLECKVGIGPTYASAK